MKHYNVTITHLTNGGYPTDAVYDVSAKDAAEAVDKALRIAKINFPTSSLFEAKTILPRTVFGADGSSLSEVA